MLTNKPASFPMMTNKAIVHHEGLLTALDQVLAGSMQRSCYNCRRVPHDVLGIFSDGQICLNIQH